MHRVKVWNGLWIEIMRVQHSFQTDESENKTDGLYHAVYHLDEPLWKLGKHAINENSLGIQKNQPDGHQNWMVVEFKAGIGTPRKASSIL